MTDINFKVRVECITYNHANYIVDTMNGFSIQKTDFPFVCVIIDDASNDGEQQIILDYVEHSLKITDKSIAFQYETNSAKIIFAQHRNNLNCYFAIYLLKENFYSQGKSKIQFFNEWNSGVEYLAKCEGDDYWVDSNKLQMQVLFLDNHPDFSLVFHNAIVHYENNKVQDQLFADLQTREYTPRELIINWLIPTASILCRVKFADYYTRLKINTKYVIYGDNMMKLAYLHFGRVYAFADTMSKYRKHENGIVFNVSIQQRIAFIEQLLYSMTVFPEFKFYLQKSLSTQYFALSKEYGSLGEKRKMTNYLWMSLKISPQVFFLEIIKYLNYKFFHNSTFQNRYLN